MSGKSDRRNAEIFERRVRELLAVGYTAASIAKETGKSYARTVRTVQRIRPEGGAE